MAAAGGAAGERLLGGVRALTFMAAISGLRRWTSYYEDAGGGDGQGR